MDATSRYLFGRICFYKLLRQESCHMHWCSNHRAFNTYWTLTTMIQRKIGRCNAVWSQYTFCYLKGGRLHILCLKSFLGIRPNQLLEPSQIKPFRYINLDSYRLSQRKGGDKYTPRKYLMLPILVGLFDFCVICQRISNASESHKNSEQFYNVGYSYGIENFSIFHPRCDYLSKFFPLAHASSRCAHDLYAPLA